jgi:hypothetical protein
LVQELAEDQSTGLYQPTESLTLAGIAESTVPRFCAA